MALPSVNLVLDLYAGRDPLSSGSASLKPSAVLTDIQDQAVVTRQPVTASFGGESSPVVPLIPTDDPDLLPSGWTWGISFAAAGAPAPYSFFVPAGPADFTATHATPCVFTFTPTTQLTELPNGTGVQLAGGSIPAGFEADTTYYVVSASGDTFSLAATSGGDPIASTGTGSGTLTVTQWNLSALTPVASTTMMTPYLPLPSGTPAEGDVPVATGDGNATAWGESSGGFASPMTTAGDLIVGGSGGTPARLAVNATGTRKFVRSVSGGTALDTFTAADIPQLADYAPTGLTGATTASRYVGGTASGAPGSGTFLTGDFVIDQTGKIWICTSGGSPGTWAQVSGGGGGGTLTTYIAPKVVTLSQSGGNVAFDASAGNVGDLTLTASGWTISNPTNLVNGQLLHYRLLQDSTGGRTVSWGTIFDWGSSGGVANSAPTLTATASKGDILGFQYWAAVSKLAFLGATFPQGY